MNYSEAVEKTDSLVEQILADLDREIIGLENRVTALAGRLVFVMSPEGPAEEDPDVATDGRLSGIEIGLLRHGQKISRLGAEVGRLTERLRV